ncbi:MULTISPECIES: DegQ family serine endoprotease [unclassified Pseudovibrio]|uniref:DegQ family serine endoprotease n=1 Tax=unclassified Pseudovibrio TaxID=2627060 RepID=UPI0007AE4249|nr:MULTISPECIES: DegQ family serine endoprotease [unclassified Pseudovibrio]KZL15158.1 putative periplasmic serine endoprotease DegP-like precursor [Pseudovibrio sp. Ad37]KZL23890.1 putative periplasmic serine endoprotease DegP-like precursor [Pseudovibrio sp. WM33]
MGQIRKSAAHLLFCAVLGTTGVVATQSTGALASEKTVPTSQAEISLSFAPIVKKVAPAVVNVYASRTVQERRRVSPFFDDPFFRRFFGEQSDRFAPRSRSRVQSSLGSGVIVSADGTIITNHHVIAGADEVRVALSDRREFDADIILMDERTDLAVLKVRNAEGAFPVVPFANSDELEVGDLVLAIGNPFGVGQTVTQGIVSAVARNQVGVSDYQFFIQTDAAINPGNSGGALVDLNGHLVGVNTAIFSRSGGSNGIGFAIPANMVEVVASAADEGGIVRRPWVGTSVQPVSSDIAASLGLERPSGVLVTRIQEGSPADRAGIRVGDLIMSVGGTQVDDPDAYGYRLATKKVGGVTRFEMLRGGEAFAVEISLERAPETVARDEREIKGNSPFTGVRVMNLSPAVAEELRMYNEFSGVVIADIKARSTAAYVGFKPGDIVVEINGAEVQSTKDLSKLTGKKQRTWNITFKRDGQLRQVSLR